MTKRRPEVEAPPLSVRSAVLSVLLGCYPDALPAARLVATGAYFEMGESAVRVALTRAVASGDLERTDAGYRTGPRLLARYEQQAEAVAPQPRPWDGAWETVVVTAAARPAAERTALRQVLDRHRLAELREGVWVRPANLRRSAGYAAHPDLLVCESRHADPSALAERLWDLREWAATARERMADLEATSRPVARLTAAAALVRHLSSDPILPAELLPQDWPGRELRMVYAAYQRELRDLASAP